MDKGEDMSRLPTTRYAAKVLLQRMAKKEAKALRMQKELVAYQLGFENTSVSNQMVEQEVKKAEEKLKLKTVARKEPIEAKIGSNEQQRQEKMKIKWREIEKDMEAERAKGNNPLTQEWQRQLEEQERRAAYLRGVEDDSRRRTKNR